MKVPEDFEKEMTERNLETITKDVNKAVTLLLLNN